LDLTTRDNFLTEIRDKLVQLHTVVLGTNGDKGMHGELREVSGKVQYIEKQLPFLQTKDGCIESRESCVKNFDAERKRRIDEKEKKGLTRREQIMLVFTAVMAAAAVVSFFVKP